MEKLNFLRERERGEIELGNFGLNLRDVIYEWSLSNERDG